MGNECTGNISVLTVFSDLHGDEHHLDAD